MEIEGRSELIDSVEIEGGNEITSHQCNSRLSFQVISADNGNTDAKACLATGIRIEGLRSDSKWQSRMLQHGKMASAIPEPVYKLFRIW